jgi:sugar-specific transcriptional regulator TrmB
MELQNSFLQIGLNENHLKVYLGLLEKGKATITQIAQETGLPRSTCYILITDLLDSGLISEFQQEKTRFYRSESPKKLLVLVEQKLSKLQRDFENLESGSEKLIKMYEASNREPKIKYLTGTAAIHTTLLKILDSKSELLVQSTSNDINTGLDINNKFLPDFLKRLNEERIVCREILNYNTKNYSYKQTSGNNRHTIYLIRINLEAMRDLTKFIWEDNMLSIDFKRKLVVHVKDQQFSDAEADQFNYLWEILEKQSGIN